MTVEWHGDEITSRIRQAAMTGIVAVTEDLRSDAVKLFQSGGRSGVAYKRGSVTHIASAPGEPPASDTGRLVGATRTEFDNDNLVGQVIFSTGYAAALEFGTKKMAPRPYAAPLLEAKKDAIIDRVAAEIRAVL